MQYLSEEILNASKWKEGGRSLTEEGREKDKKKGEGRE